MKDIKAKMVTFTDSGNFIGKPRKLRAWVCRNEKPPVIEIVLTGDGVVMNSVHIDVKSVRKALEIKGA